MLYTILNIYRDDAVVLLDPREFPLKFWKASQLDPYLDELATNITRKQYAEMAWMRRWMEERNYDIEGNDLRCSLENLHKKKHRKKWKLIDAECS